MSIINEIESTAEQDIKPIADVIASKTTIIADAHTFFDIAKSKIEHVIEEVIARAENVEEAIEATILSAFGHAAEQTQAVIMDEVQSS